MTLNKEDGTGMAGANSYADVPDGDMYHEAHLYASVWTAATEARKEAALMMATRLIDSLFQFNGSRASASQALQWPRAECRDPDGGRGTLSVLLPMSSGFVPYNIVPAAVLQATCELARELLAADRTAAPPGEGIDTVSAAHATHAASGSGSDSTSSTTKYSKVDTRQILPPVVRAMLAKFGAPVSGGSGAVRLVRT